ncbi:16285_t:CDS:2, partial [Acaulospora morrowiae]
NQLSGLKFTSSVNTSQLSDPGNRSISSVNSTDSTEEILHNTPDPNLAGGQMMSPPFQHQQPPAMGGVYNVYPPYGGGFQPQSRPPFTHFVGGFWNPDDAPPAYDGPKEGYNDDKKN